MSFNPSSSRYCPICNGNGKTYLEFENQTLYHCSECGCLFYFPYPAERWNLSYEALESCPFYIERGADLLFYTRIVGYVREILEVSGRPGNGTSFKVLEVGCSFGFLIDIARRLLGWDVEGVDPAPCAGLGAAELGLRIEQARVEEIPGENLYDAIISVESIEHVSNPLDHLQVMARLLREDGFILLTTPDAARGDLGPHLWPGEHYVIFSQTGLERLLIDAGLTHYFFFRTSIPEIIAVVAARKKLTSSVLAIFNASRFDEVADWTVNYLQSKIAEVPQHELLSRGLYFRLFELFVNQGRYAEAEAIEPTVDTLLGFDRDTNRWSLMEPVVSAMEAAKDSHSYLQSGPACLAPYLFYKGMLSLNHKKEYSEAAKLFGGAARLFRREVTGFDLTHFRTFLLASEYHEDIAALAAGDSLPVRMSTLHEGVPYALVVPWFRGGVAEFRAHVPDGPMKRHRVSGGSSVVFTVLCRENNLSAFALNLALFAKSKVEPISLTLTVSEGNDPSVMRRVVIEVKPATWNRGCSGIHEAFEIFSFPPIAQSRGKQLTLSIEVPRELVHMSVLCLSVEGESTVVAGQAVDNLIPIAVPYFATSDSSAKLGPGAAASELVTVLLTTGDSEGSICRTIDSLMVQDYPRLEIVVVERNSSDGMTNRIRREHPEVNLLVLNEEVEINRAYNMGMGVAKGEFVLVLGECVVANRGAVSRLVEVMTQSRNIGLVGWSSAIDDSCSENSDLFFIDRTFIASERLLDSDIFIAAPSPHGFFMRRSVADDLGHLFDERLSLKWACRELGLRCWLQGFAGLHVPLSVIQSGPNEAPEWDAVKDAASQVNSALIVAFRTLGMRCFVRAAVKILAGAQLSASIKGFGKFLASIGENRFTRRALQQRRRVSDTHLQVLSGGIRARIPWSEAEQQQW